MSAVLLHTVRKGTSCICWGVCRCCLEASAATLGVSACRRAWQQGSEETAHCALDVDDFSTTSLSTLMQQHCTVTIRQAEAVHELRDAYASTAGYFSSP
jgi:hypothetical protein